MKSEFSKFISFLFDETDINEIDSEYKKVLSTFAFNLLLNSPHATYLFNKFANNLYSNIDEDEILKFIKEIIKIKQMKYNDLHIAKNIKEKSDTFKLKEKLYKEINEKLKFPLNLNELSFLFELYKNDVIDLSFLLEKVKIEKISKDSDIYNLLNKEKKENEKNIKTVKELEDIIKSELNEKKYCTFCPLLGKETVILDSNRKYLKDINVVILGINPGVEEVKENKPFVGRAGKLLRKVLSEFFDKNNIGYLITNVILCHTPNQTHLKDIEDKVLSKCKYFEDIIDIVNPKIIIGLGDIVKKALNIEGKLTEIVGKLFKFKGKYDVILNLHPSSVLRNKSKNEAIFIDTFNEITNYILYKDKIENKVNVKIINDINELPENETFLDVKILKDTNEFLIIMIDENGNKKYYKMPFKVDVYVSKQSLPHYCSYIEDINKLQKFEINDYEFFQMLKQRKLKEIKEYIENCKI